MVNRFTIGVYPNISSRNTSISNIIAIYPIPIFGYLFEYVYY